MGFYNKCFISFHSESVDGVSRIWCRESVDNVFERADCNVFSSSTGDFFILILIAKDSFQTTQSFFPYFLFFLAGTSFSKE